MCVRGGVGRLVSALVARAPAGLGGCMSSGIAPRRVVPRARAGNPRVWLELRVGGGAVADALRTRLVFELFADLAPKTAENVRCLCTGERGKGLASGLPLSYERSEVWRVRPSRKRDWERAVEGRDAHLAPLPPRDPRMGPGDTLEPVINHNELPDPAVLENKRTQRRRELGEDEPHVRTAVVEIGHLAVPNALEHRGSNAGAPTPAAVDSIYGGPFEPENFTLPHDTSGLLTMMVDEAGMCGSAFGVTLKSCPQLDARQCVFGRLLRGYGTLRELERVDTRSSGADVGRPVERIEVVACGEVEYDGDDGLATGGDGDPFPPWPADATAMGSDRYESRLSAAAQVRAFGNEMFKAGEFAGAVAKYVKALRYLDKAWNRDVDDHATERSEREMRRQARIPLLLNCAAARLRLGDPRGAIEDCLAAHDEENRRPENQHDPQAAERFNPKACFRMGQAHAHLNEFEEACKHFAKALSLCPNDAGITRELDKAKWRLEERRRRQRRAMALAFGGADNGLSEADEAMRQKSGAFGTAGEKEAPPAAGRGGASAAAAEAAELRAAYEPDSDDD